MGDTTRHDSGIYLNASLLVARPVGAIIENGGTLYISTNAVVAAFDEVRASGTDIIAFANVAAVGGVGGATAGTLAVDLYELSGPLTKPLAKVLRVLVLAKSFAGGPQAAGLRATVTFAGATKGSIVSSGLGWAFVETDANGEFDCVPSNSADDTAYFAVVPAEGVGGLADAGKGVSVVSIESPATWTA